MRLTVLALLGVVAACVLGVGAANADSGTFSGSITPTDCGPLHPVQVAAGDTTIVAAAAMTISANDIRLELYDPSGALKVDGDTATSPETVRSQSRAPSPSLKTRISPFSRGVISAPHT